MGGISLDPCSEAAFESVVQADTSYSLLDRNQDGLQLPWFGNVLCNPPGGLVVDFWRRAFEQPIDQMIWIGFSVEQLCILADEEYHPLDFSLCMLRKRIPFRRHDGYEGSPSHGNYVVGVSVDPDAFQREFGELGKISHGTSTILGTK